MIPANRAHTDCSGAPRAAFALIPFRSAGARGAAAIARAEAQTIWLSPVSAIAFQLVPGLGLTAAPPTMLVPLMSQIAA